VGLDVQQVYAGYLEDIMILQGITLSAADRRITAVLGANGVGKSTLLKTIAGFVRPAGGRILWNGRDMSDISPWDLAGRRIAFIPQGRSVFPYLTVAENLALGCWSFRRDTRRVRHEVERILDRFPSLANLRTRRAGNLSGGQQRLLEVARALLIEPELMLFDEPTAGLSPVLTDEIYEILGALRGREGKTIVLADQNIRKALALADDVYVIELGRNKMSGPASQFAMMEVVENWLL